MIEPIVGAMRVVDGVCADDAAPYAASLTAPTRMARGREDERLFVLLDLAGSVAPHFYRELCEVVAQTYWNTSGSTTAALRQAATAANRHLFRSNLAASPTERCHGGLTCVAVRDEELFILQAGPAWACLIHDSDPEVFPREQAMSYLGMGPLAEVRLYHAFVAAGDTLLLATPTLVQTAGREGISRVVLPGATLQAVLAGLEQVGAGANFAVLVARWVPSVQPPAVRQASRFRRLFKRERRGSPDSLSGQGGPRPARRSKPEREPGPGLGERVRGGLRVVARGLVGVGPRAASIGRWFAGAGRRLWQRVLPGRERDAHRRVRRPRPIPKENPTVMTAIAVGIPLLLAVTVALAYSRFGLAEQAGSLVGRAEGEIALAQAAGKTSDDTRVHWEAALEYTEAALELVPDEAAASAWRALAQDSLDSINSIVRLSPVELWDLGPSSLPREIVVQGQMIYVLDPANGWATRLTLDETGEAVVDEVPPILVRTEQDIGGQVVGNFIDFIWVEVGGERQTSGLVVLEEGGALLTYDPNWEGEGGIPQLTRSLLGTPPSSSPKAVDSYEGRLYILGDDQIERYEPRGHTYPDPPSRYFTVPPRKPLSTALDMAIDGSIYILYIDGTILKVLQGEPQPFEVRGVPGNFSQVVAFAVDPQGNSGVVYVADRGNRRVVVLGPDGEFWAQYYAAGSFDALEALVVDEAKARMYVISGGKVYVVALP